MVLYVSAPEQTPVSAAIPTADILGYKVAHCTSEEAAQWSVARCLGAPSPHLLVTLNPEIIVQAEADPTLKRSLQNADLTVADGVGITWAAQRFGVTLPERVPGVELMERILVLGGERLRVYFLGAEPGVAARAAEVAQERYGTVTAGVQHGYFKRPEEIPQVVEHVARSGAHLLLAGLGEGQERFLDEHRDDLNIRLMIGVGGALDVLSGEVKRTPLWTRKLRLEWAYRVGLDPKRWHRFPRLARFVRLVYGRTRA